MCIGMLNEEKPRCKHTDHSEESRKWNDDNLHERIRTTNRNSCVFFGGFSHSLSERKMKKDICKSVRGRLKTSTRIYSTHKYMNTMLRCSVVCSGMRAEASNLAHVVLYIELVFKWCATTHIAFKFFPCIRYTSNSKNKNNETFRMCALVDS